MRRAALIASLALAAAIGVAAAEERSSDAGQAQAEEGAAVVPGDRFVVMSDACGASRYAHLLGREYARVHQAALLPTDSVVQNRSMLRTLEYTPHRLNVVVGAEGRIVAIGCF